MARGRRTPGGAQAMGDATPPDAAPALAALAQVVTDERARVDLAIHEAIHAVLRGKTVHGVPAPADHPRHRADRAFLLGLWYAALDEHAQARSQWATAREATEEQLTQIDAHLARRSPVVRLEYERERAGVVWMQERLDALLVGRLSPEDAVRAHDVRTGTFQEGPRVLAGAEQTCRAYPPTSAAGVRAVGRAAAEATADPGWAAEIAAADEATLERSLALWRACASLEASERAHLEAVLREEGGALAPVIAQIGRLGERDIARARMPWLERDDWRRARASALTGSRIRRSGRPGDSDRVGAERTEEAVVHLLGEVARGEWSAKEGGTLLFPADAAVIVERMEQMGTRAVYQGVRIIEHPPAEGTVTFEFSAELRLAGRVEGVPVTVAYRTKLDVRSRAGAAATRETKARAAAAAFGIEVDRAMERARPRPHVAVIQGPALVTENLPEVSAQALAGTGRCTHRESAWHTGSHHLTCDCPRCGARRIARVPLHRVPQSHPAAARLRDPAEAARYLALERYHALLVGDEPPTSIAELRRRDGVASLDPTHYAAHTPREPAVARQSAEAALAGRRAPVR